MAACSSFGNMDLLINLYFPQIELEAKKHIDDCTFKTRVLREIVKYYKRKKVNLSATVPLFLTSGSRACNLRLPLLFHYNDLEKITGTTGSDCDLMIIHNDLYAGQDQKLQVVTEGHPTNFCEVIAAGKEVDMGLVEQDQGKYILSAEKYKWYVLTTVGLAQGQVRGPSVQGTIGNISEQLGTAVAHETDRVPALLCYDRPHVQWSDWHDPGASWPSPDTQRAVNTGPIFLVPVASPVSPKPSQEWRFSFSYQEIQLAKELSIHHRQVYLTVKYLMKYVAHAHGTDSFKTYFIMNSLFWMCEKIPPEQWKSDKSYCIMSMLKFICASLKEKCLRQYMNPNYNLLTFSLDEWALRLVHILETFQSEANVIALLLEAQKSWRFEHLRLKLEPVWNECMGTLQSTDRNDVEALLNTIFRRTAESEPVARAVQTLWNKMQILAALNPQTFDDPDAWKKSLEAIGSSLSNVSTDKYNTILEFAGVMLKGKVSGAVMGAILGLVNPESSFGNVTELPWLKLECDTVLTMYFKTHMEYKCYPRTFKLPYDDSLTMVSEAYYVLINSINTVAGITPDEIKHVVTQFPASVPEELHNKPIVLFFTKLRDDTFGGDSISYPAFDQMVI